MTSLLESTRIEKEEYGRKRYLKEKNIHQVRELFKTRFGLSDFAGNYKNNKKYKSSDWKCKCGREIEKESHIISGNCEVYEDIRVKYDDLEDEENLLKFFKEVIEKLNSE